MSTPARKNIAKAIYFTTWVGTITVLWQAVRFCQGHVGAIALDQIIALTNQILGADPEAVSSEVVSSPLQMAMVPYFKAIYFFGGIGAWFGSAGIVLISGLSFGQIIEVGFEKFKAERRSANAPIAG